VAVVAQVVIVLLLDKLLMLDKCLLLPLAHQEQVQHHGQIKVQMAATLPLQTWGHLRLTQQLPQQVAVAVEVT
jgi:hypothetical protein